MSQSAQYLIEESPKGDMFMRDFIRHVDIVYCIFLVIKNVFATPPKCHL